MDRVSKIFMTLTALTIIGIVIYKEITRPKPLFTNRDQVQSKYNLELNQSEKIPTSESENQSSSQQPQVQSQISFKNGIFTIGWDLLYSYNFKTKKIPSDIKYIDGKNVRIPGYIVPLSDDYTKLDEFLLVPDAQSCIHVPPPPPNLIVWVKLEKAISADDAPYPAWVYGIFSVESTKSQYGDAAYKMIGKKLEQYED